MKASDFKVGDRIEWAKPMPGYIPSKDGEGVVVERRGRNILVDTGGTYNWLYVTTRELAWIRKIED